jgi:MFS family permease
MASISSLRLSFFFIIQVALGCFVAISGFTQLISPMVGMLSDTYRPPPHFQIGQRMPFLSLGAVLSVFGLFGEFVESYHKLWIPYAVFFFFHMIGLNITYAMMIALIPDQVPHSQTGIANGILAFLLVTGSLTGFGFFHFYSDDTIQVMYGLYICIVVRNKGLLLKQYLHHLCIYDNPK